jgi:hypothetical protein
MAIRGLPNAYDVGGIMFRQFLDALPLGKQALRTNKMSLWYICDIDNINE